MVLLKNSVWLLHLLQGALALSPRRRESGRITEVHTPTWSSATISSATSVTPPVSNTSTSRTLTKSRLRTSPTVSSIASGSAAPHSSPANKSSSRTVTRSRLRASPSSSRTPLVSRTRARTTGVSRTPAPTTRRSSTSTAQPSTTVIGYYMYESVEDLGGCQLPNNDALYAPASSTSGEKNYQPCVYYYSPTQTVAPNKGPITSTLIDGVVVYCTSAEYVDFDVTDQKTCVGSSSVISTNTAVAAAYYSSSSSVQASIEASISSASVAASPTAAVWIAMGSGAGTLEGEYGNTPEWAAFYVDSGSLDQPDMCEKPTYTVLAKDAIYIGSEEYPDTIKFGSNKKLKDCVYQAKTWDIHGAIGGDTGIGYFYCPDNSLNVNATCTGDFPAQNNQTVCWSDDDDMFYPKTVCRISPDDHLS
ncbi:uncharacterized protein N7459_001405 [Penicillium hispanicum]|uniref:uncharacterized protein n=1 Tax=Penicillium hispanicum TaxID=1080232 RepID=UPI0025411C80|nr:uncharacterized protein N7459_001405 [Penicillium hispanicum]KAJ5595197.1 hypothetical protein N7459_001405 [Penicillium hispanicum]